VRLEASTKPHVHNLIHEFLINMAFTMACPNFKKGLKMVSRPLGIKALQFVILAKFKYLPNLISVERVITKLVQYPPF
jgi:hypothetical protein